MPVLKGSVLHAKLSTTVRGWASLVEAMRTHHEWACTAVPITDPPSGLVLGVLDVAASHHQRGPNADDAVRMPGGYVATGNT